MSENPPATARPELAASPPPPHKSEGEAPPVFRDRHASTSKPPRRPEEVPRPTGHTMSENPRATPNRVFIAGLPEHARKEDLESYFGKPILGVDIKTGYGFVEFESREAVEESVTKHREGLFMGTKIQVQFCRSGRTTRYNRRSEGGAPRVSRDQHASISRGPEDERSRDAAGSGKVRQPPREAMSLEEQLEWQEAEVVRLTMEEEKLVGKCKRKDGQITKLERDIRHMQRSHQEEVQRRTQEIQALEEQLKKSEELSARRSAELSETQTFLSTKDRLPETEVLNTVRDLNEHIYQVAVSLTEELEKLEPPPVTNRMDGDPTSGPHASAAVQLSRNRDLTGLTYLFQSYFCSQAARMTSSWSRYQELAMLEPIYQRLSASEGQAVSARWRSLTYSHLSQPPPNPVLLVEELSKVLHATGLFSSTQHSLEFARTVALEGIESTIRLAQRLELAFMVEVTSSDMSLLFEATDTIFDDTKMTNDFGSSDGSTPGKQDKIVGTTEVGVGKSICDGVGKGRRMEILLKPKVVLERDVVKS